ncbi:carboxymuconolactone decarboxylase family protein [uncultured Anaeromusa sp.]|uniref:carboxymuconolactone decarboxylase family protein n=1 Tax=uncultured Anaeromusa sp. TaxID=673273 RepID=UPI0029C725DF|nr:carboxymuconolactone decarboxylase family protein [uncultured Anaeromusa sp.]
MADPKKLLNDFQKGLGKLGQDAPEVAAAFVQLSNACFVEGEIPAKYKELMALAIGVFTRCEYCIAYHVFKAIEEGANRDEIMEAATLAVAFGGSPSAAYSATLVEECLDAFCE